MDEPSRHFEVASAGELRRRYYSPGELPPALHLAPEKVPAKLHALIPYAEKWGISDDILRGDALANASQDEIRDLRAVVRANDDELDDWLAGPEARNPPFSAEYLAFSNMRMAADGC